MFDGLLALPLGGFSALGLRTSLFDFFWLLAMIGSFGGSRPLASLHPGQSGGGTNSVGEGLGFVAFSRTLRRKGMRSEVRHLISEGPTKEAKMTASFSGAWRKELSVLLDHIETHPSHDLTAQRERVMVLRQLLSTAAAGRRAA